MFELMYKFWAHSPSDGSAFFIANMDEIKSSVHALVDLMVVEQHHFRDSPYYYKPLPGQFRDGTGLVWSFARPSDDQTTLGYNIPQNLFAVSVLSKLEDMNSALWDDEGLGASLSALRTSIEEGIETYGIVNITTLTDVFAEDWSPDSDAQVESVFAFEVDGWGNWTRYVLDDANMPNLLWLPYLSSSGKGENHGLRGYVESGIVERTRQAVLSARNENFFSHRGVKGLGSQHTSQGLRPEWPGPQCDSECVWHLGLIMQAMTTTDQDEKHYCLEQVMGTAWHGLMHEGFAVSNTTNYNRDLFGWANSMFAEWIITDFMP